MFFLFNINGLLADIVLVIHLLFIVFVVAGALLLWKWPWIAWLHIPAAAWGVLIEFAGWICPLTPLENRLRRAAQQEGIEGGFIEHYLIPIIYPPGLTTQWQWILGAFVLVLNLGLYGLYLYKRYKSRRLKKTAIKKE